MAFINAFNHFLKGKRSRKINQVDFTKQKISNSSELVANNSIVQEIVKKQLNAKKK
ncbi:hypothetical protein [Bacillus massiliglaciei]|uniref:hypothetical protein n=1 Tax=Bacillus massiliglaciei TaxID=1816693 RepID=UPI0018FEE86A|nr:hypothetical protein [Bacillus massiliglaciei]